MPDTILSDGTNNWSGGFDTSRNPSDIALNQYSKAFNIIIPKSGGGISCRFGFRCINLQFTDKRYKEIYRSGSIQAEGWFSSNGNTYLIALVDGYIFKFTESGDSYLTGQIINFGDRNSNTVPNGWVITIPDGCIVNNGVDLPFYITENAQRRTDPSKQEIGIGRMGVYMQDRLFFVDQSSKQILASDAYQPTMFTLEGTNISGFACPDSDQTITAIGKQKSILVSAEGGNLIWSSSSNIYSSDVRGTRSDWANQVITFLYIRLGKVTETVPGFTACSSYSFESFNTNIHFRSLKYGIADLKQSQYQFVNQESANQQSIEASAYLDNDTDWMLKQCYSRACNDRLFTTIAPQVDETGSIYWNGILSYNPAAVYGNSEQVPRRYESIFTGIRPWCLTVVNRGDKKDQLFVHSKDSDGFNRLYLMDEDLDYDIDHTGKTVEIQGFIETRAYNFQDPFTPKRMASRMYRLNRIERTININVSSRPELYGPWISFWDMTHNVTRINLVNGVFSPVNSKAQTRPYIIMAGEKFDDCYPMGLAFNAIQYRIAFTGPINLEFFAATSIPEGLNITTTQEEPEYNIVIYDAIKDFNYSIAPTYE